MFKNNRILRVLAAVMTVIMVACAFAGCSAVVQDPVVAGIYDAILCIGAECIVKCGIQYLNVAYLCNYGILHNCAAACKGTPI